MFHKKRTLKFKKRHMILQGYQNLCAITHQLVTRSKMKYKLNMEKYKSLLYSSFNFSFFL